MEGDDQPPPRHAELYVRSLRPDGYYEQQAAILDRLDGLIDRGVLSERRVRLCGTQLPASHEAATSAVGEALVARLRAFELWARRNDRTLAPAVQRREVEDTLTESRYRALRLPAMLLAEFRGDSLVCVTPHRAGETTLSVPDRVTQLERGEAGDFRPVSVRTPGTETVEEPTESARLAGR